MVVLGDWEITVNSFEITKNIFSSAYSSFNADEGSSYVVVNATIKNTGTQADNFLQSFSISKDVKAKILYQEKYEYSASDLMGHSDDLHNTYLNPLESKTGIIAFSVVDEAAQQGKLSFVLSFGNTSNVYELK